MEFIGPLGGLVPLDCASTIQPQRAARVTTRESVGRVRRGYQAPRNPPRVWDMSIDITSPGVVDRVAAFAAGSYGPGPFVWVPSDAQAINVLTPAQADLTAPMDSAYTSAGPVAVGGEYLPGSAVAVIPSSWRAVADYIPVIPGVPVTVSLWCQSGTGAPQMSVAWRTGSNLSLTETVTGTSGGTWQRLTYTGTPAAGVDSIRFGARSSVSMIAGPTVTWTTTAQPWGHGRGAAKVVITDHQETPITVAGPSYYEATWRVEEIGE